MEAAGSFDVEMAPDDDTGAVSRFRLTKVFRGDLAGTSEGHMLSFTGSVAGSAGYVAIEEVSGTVANRTGSFVLLHRGVLDRGSPELAVDIVPDSGTGELAGIRGSMTIVNDDGSHTYALTFAFD